MSHSARKHSLLAGALLGAGATAAVVCLGLVVGSGTAAGAAAPENTSPPTISGTALRGQTLHADPGTWTGTHPIDFAYHWQRCNASGADCSNIGGATHRDYTLGSADVGRTVRVVVTASNSSGSATAASSPSAVVATPQAPAASSPPTISGQPQVGATLTANPGTWVGPGPITFTYEWWRCDQVGGTCHTVPKAVFQTFTLGPIDVGHTLRVRVRAKNSNGTTPATSVPTAVVVGTVNGCPLGVKVAPVTAVVAPARLVLDGLSVTPVILRGDTRNVVVRLHVSDTCGQPVAGALVYATAVPYNQLATPSEVSTDGNGWATIPFRTLKGYPATKQQQLLVLFARARKPGENVLVGISNRRLFSVRVVL